MKRFLVIPILFITSLVFADAEWDARMERIGKWRDEEIARAHELKKLELQTRILAQELKLSRDNISVDNSVRSVQGTGVTSTVDVDTTNINQQVAKFRSKK